MQYLSCVWVLTLMSSRPIHVVASVKMSFLFKAVWTMNHIVYPSSMDGHQLFPPLVNHAAVNRHVQICLSPCFQFLGVCTQEWNC